MEFGEIWKIYILLGMMLTACNLTERAQKTSAGFLSHHGAFEIIASTFVLILMWPLITAHAIRVFMRKKR